MQVLLPRSQDMFALPHLPLRVAIASVRVKLHCFLEWVENPRKDTFLVSVSVLLQRFKETKNDCGEWHNSTVWDPCLLRRKVRTLLSICVHLCFLTEEAVQPAAV